MRRQSGFTLLEVMIALAILATALVVIGQAHIDATRDISRAKMLTVAAMLARAKMAEIEFEMKREGFPEFEEEECGDFSDEDYGGLTKFGWCYTIEKIELPEDIDFQRLLLGQQGGEGEGEGEEDTEQQPKTGLASLLETLGVSDQSPIMDLLNGPAAAMVASQFSMIRNVIEQSIRRIILTVSWREGTREKSLTLVLYVTDPNVIERGIRSPASLMGGGMGRTAGSSMTGGAARPGGGGGKR